MFVIFKRWAWLYTWLMLCNGISMWGSTQLVVFNAGGALCSSRVLFGQTCWHTGPKRPNALRPAWIRGALCKFLPTHPLPSSSLWERLILFDITCSGGQEMNYWCPPPLLSKNPCFKSIKGIDGYKFIRERNFTGWLLNFIAHESIMPKKGVSDFYCITVSEFTRPTTM